MAIRKRGKTYQIDYYDPDGKRVVKGGFKTKTAAANELAARTLAMAQGKYFEEGKVYTTTFDELVKNYKEFCKVNNRSYKSSKSWMIKLLTQEFSGKVLSKISYRDLVAYQTKLRNTRGARGKILTVATVNRYMATLRHMFAVAVEWEMLDRNPFEKGRSLQIKENNKRLRFLTEEEIERVIAECPTEMPQRINGKFSQGSQALYIKDFITIAINTGMRKGEVLSLQWDQIRGNFIYLEKTKSNKGRQIPINDDLAECFKSIRKKQKLGTKYVICDGKGRRLKDISLAFDSVMKREGVTDFRPHDLRHTFASHYIMRGGSIAALQKILGHADIKMTMRYAHLSKEFAQEEIQLLNGLTSSKKNMVTI